MTPVEQEVKQTQPEVEQIPVVQISVEDKVQQENEKNTEMSAEEETESTGQKLRYTYKEGRFCSDKNSITCTCMFTYMSSCNAMNKITIKLNFEFCSLLLEI